MNTGDSAARTHVELRAVTRRFGDVAAVSEVSLSVPQGQTLALLGPSGCGKTTLLRLIAGLDQPDAGEVHIGGRLVGGNGTHIEPRSRGVGLVFQEGALFPHMSVLENVAYGLGDNPDLDVARRALDLVDLPAVEGRLPGSLSGGERQRVALARALAPAPSVLLLDEPMGSLDADRRIRIRTQIAELLDRLDITAVFVTHDQEEAFVVGDEVAIMRSGRVLQVGTPSEIYDAPVDAWVARFVGDANLVPGSGGGATVDTWLGEVALKEPISGPCTVVIRPEHLVLGPGSDGQVESVEFYGHDTAYSASFSGQVVNVRHMNTPLFASGENVSVRYDGPAVVAFPESRRVRPPEQPISG